METLRWFSCGRAEEEEEEDGGGEEQDDEDNNEEDCKASVVFLGLPWLRAVFASVKAPAPQGAQAVSKQKQMKRLRMRFPYITRNTSMGTLAAPFAFSRHLARSLRFASLACLLCIGDGYV